MEKDGLFPVPIFINGVEAHTVVRDLLTSSFEQRRRAEGIFDVDTLSPDCAEVRATAVRLITSFWGLGTSVDRATEFCRQLACVRVGCRFMDSQHTRAHPPSCLPSFGRLMRW